MARDADYIYLVRRLLLPYGIKVSILPLGHFCLYDRENSSFVISRSDFMSLDSLREFVRLHFNRDFNF